MGTGDFLRKGAQTQQQEQYLIAGALGVISTNSTDILAAARDSFCPVKSSFAGPQMHWRFWVDPESTTEAPWPKPTYRGLDHLIFGGLDTQNSFLIDLRRRHAIGRFSPAMAADQQRWRTMIFPNLLTLMGPAIGVTGLHCACVVRNGNGLLLTGGSGCGKSTLAMAMALEGFGFLSDDWTYFSHGEDDRLTAWGLIPQLKLLPTSIVHFPQFAQFPREISANGEVAYQIVPHPEIGISRVHSCEPREVVFLERTPNPAFTLTRMSKAEAVAQLQANLLADNPESIHAQITLVQRLVDGGPWLLRYGESPAMVAKKLAESFDGMS